VCLRPFGSGLGIDAGGEKVIYTLLRFGHTVLWLIGKRCPVVLSQVWDRQAVSQGISRRWSRYAITGAEFFGTVVGSFLGEPDLALDEAAYSGAKGAHSGSGWC
jgi:hypothetical protein